MIKRSSSLLAAPLALCALALGCADDPPGNLFDEEGTFALKAYAFVGGDALTDIEDGARGNAFLLRFSPDHDVVAAASCASEGGTNGGVTSSICNITPTDSAWICGCYAYSFDGSIMSWQYFEPGDDPAPLSDTDGDETENDPSDTVEVAEIDGSPSSYTFFGLPDGLFGSEDDTSRYVFERKANSVWSGSSVPADLDGDGESELDECSMGCFGEVLD